MGSNWSSVAPAIQLAVSFIQLLITATKEFYPSVISFLRRGDEPKSEADLTAIRNSLSRT
jgi:hypothetical protein